jgi:hypothetical protein
MPVEIRELVIRATVESGEGEKQPAKPEAGGKADQEMIAEVVEQVLEILRKERER